MGQAGEMLRRDLDGFAESIRGAKIKKSGNVTVVTMPDEQGRALERLAASVTDAEAELLDCFGDDEEGW